MVSIFTQIQSKQLEEDALLQTEFWWSSNTCLDYVHLDILPQILVTYLDRSLMDIFEDCDLPAPIMVSIVFFSSVAIWSRTISAFNHPFKW